MHVNNPTAADAEPHNTNKLQWVAPDSEGCTQLDVNATSDPPLGRSPAGSSSIRDLSQQGRLERLLKTGCVDSLRATQTVRHAAIDGCCMVEDSVHADLQHRGGGTCTDSASLACVQRSAASGRHLVLHIATTPCCSWPAQLVQCSAVAQHLYLQGGLYMHVAQRLMLSCALETAVLDLLCGSKQHRMATGCLHMALSTPPKCEALLRLHQPPCRQAEKHSHLIGTGCC